jgi:hypothetical protein
MYLGYRCQNVPCERSQEDKAQSFDRINFPFLTRPVSFDLHFLQLLNILALSREVYPDHSGMSNRTRKPTLSHLVTYIDAEAIP